MYNANSPQQIHDANKILETFSNSNDCLSKCQIVLDRGAVSLELTKVLFFTNFIKFKESLFTIHCMCSCYKSTD
jgi:hypothetical protein